MSVPASVATPPRPTARERQFALVLIEWSDSHTTEAWTPINLAEDDIEDRVLLCRSVGWLVHDGPRAKVVAPHMAETAQMCGVMTIPTTAILRMTVLSERGTAQGRGLRKSPRA